MRADTSKTKVILLPVLVWIFAICFCLLKALAGLDNFPTAAIGLFIACLSSSCIGFALTRGFKRDGKIELTQISRFLGVGLLFFWVCGETLMMTYAPSTEGMSLAQIRAGRGEMFAAAIPTWVLYINYLSSASGYIGTFLALRSKRWRTFALWLLATGCYAYISGRYLGGRFPTFCILLFAGGYYIFTYWDDLVKRKFLALSVCGMIFGVASLLNAAFVTLRFEKGAAGVEAYYHQLDGDALLKLVGIDGAPDQVAFVVGIVDEYLGKSVGFLDKYIGLQALDPQWGRFNNRILANRVAAYDWGELKEETDDVMVAIGIDYNVWATGLRDVFVDFQWAAPIYCFIIFGVIYGASYNSKNRSLGAGLVFFMIFAWTWGSPFFGLLRAPGFELASYFGIMWWALDIVSPNNILSIRRTAK